jgi:hypothetical protein
VIEWAPTARAAVLIDALPALTGELPSEVAPSKNSTEPVAPVGVTVAVRATPWPATDGLGDEVTAVELDAALTVCECTADVLPVKLASPE